MNSQTTQAVFCRTRSGFVSAHDHVRSEAILFVDQNVTQAGFDTVKFSIILLNMGVYLDLFSFRSWKSGVSPAYRMLQFYLYSIKGNLRLSSKLILSAALPIRLLTRGQVPVFLSVLEIEIAVLLLVAVSAYYSTIIQLNRQEPSRLFDPISALCSKAVIPCDDVHQVLRWARPSYIRAAEDNRDFQQFLIFRAI